MAKVDRLGWTAGLAFTAYGASLGVRTNDAAVVEQLQTVLPPAYTPVDEPVVDSLFSLWVAPPANRKGRRNYHLVYADAARVARTLDLAEALARLEDTLRITVAYWAREDRLFVHAGVVGWRGQAIILAGRSHSGKTTLVAELLKAGATYYSDEMAILDPQGQAHPYPIPLSIRAQDSSCKVAPESLGGRCGEVPLPVGLVVVTQYQEGAAWRPRELSPSRALLALLDNAVAARRNPAVALPILQRVVAQAPTLKGKRGEAAGVAGKILARAEWESTAAGQKCR